MDLILLGRYLEYLSNATGLHANESLFIVGLFLQNTTRSAFRDLYNFFCEVFLGETNFW
jgi:hypothetical protein